jgi:ABC transport system ATP-binding/permease protein
MNRTPSKQPLFQGRNQGMPSLEIQSNIHGGKLTYDLTKPVINIGRDPSNDIVIGTPVVSHFHAQIVREGNQLILIHPPPSQSHTTNGLLYQGRHILGNEPFRLSPRLQRKWEG